MATNEDLNLYLKADSTGLKTGMNQAKQDVADSSEAMSQSTKKLAEDTKSAMDRMLGAFRSMATGSQEAMRDATAASATHVKGMGDHVSSAVSNIQGQMNSLSSAVSFVTKHFAALAAVAAGVGAFKEGIAATKQYTSEALQLGKALQISASDAAVMNLALGDVYVSVDDFVGIANGMQRSLKTNEEGMNKMGLATRDSEGNVRNMNEMIKDGSKILETYKEGADRNLAAQQMFGRGVQDASVILKASKADFEAADEKAKSLGLTVGKENVEAMKAYKAAMNDVDDVMLALKKSIGDAVMPIFTKFGEWLATAGPAAVTILKGALGGLVAAFWALKNGVVVVWETINAMVVSVTEPIRAVAAAMGKALQGDWAGAKAELSNVGTVIKTAWGGAMDEMYKSSMDTQAKITNLFTAPTAITKAKTSGKGYTDPNAKEDKAPKEKADKSEMKDFEAELAEKKVAYQEQQRLEGSFREFSKQQELQFWQEKLQQVKEGSNDEKSIRIKVANEKLVIDKELFEAETIALKGQLSEYKHNTDERLRLAQELAEKLKKAYGEDSKQYADAQKEIAKTKQMAHEQINQIEQMQVQRSRDRKLSEISDEQELSILRTQLGLQTNLEALEMEKKFEEQRYAIQQAALAEQLALAKLNPDKNPVEIEKLNGEREELERKHQDAMSKIQHKGILEQSKDWKGITDSITGSLATVIKGVANGTMTMGKAIKTLFASVLDTVIGTLAQIAAQWIMRTIMQAVLGKTAALSNVAANAAVAGSAAFAATAAIPIIGPGLAPAAGMAAYSGALAFGATIPAAAKGMDIPAGVNPLTQLHEKEMVLPANIAQPLRDNLNDGGGIGSGVSVTYNDHSGRLTDSDIRRNAGKIAKAVKEHLKG